MVSQLIQSHAAFTFFPPFSLSHLYPPSNPSLSFHPLSSSLNLSIFFSLPPLSPTLSFSPSSIPLSPSLSCISLPFLSSSSILLHTYSPPPHPLLLPPFPTRILSSSPFSFSLHFPFLSSLLSPLTNLCRYHCGVPVIIEGETGVGKTALLEMLSTLWNHALLMQWKKQYSQMLDVMKRKLGAISKDVCDNYQVSHSFVWTIFPQDW